MMAITEELQQTMSEMNYDTVSETAELNKRLIDVVGEFKIFLVNGEFVRNNLEIDFTMGSNPHVSNFIPKGEIWLDDRLTENDIAALIHHEIVEARLMRKGMGYEEAHALATSSEIKFRKRMFG